MKKYINKILPVLFVIFFSCEEDNTTEGVSRITYYNDIELIGDKNYIVEQGSPYIEPGAKASEGDTDVTDNIVISGTVDENTVGYYSITYGIENVDGFAKSIVRNVFVLPTARTKSEIYVGTYTGVVSTGTHEDATTITHLGDGLYFTDDIIGGRYNIGFGYGPVYKLYAYFYINADGTNFDTLLIYNDIWGEWDLSTPSLTGTTFSHGVSIGGGDVRDVVLNKQ